MRTEFHIHLARERDGGSKKIKHDINVNKVMVKSSTYWSALLLE